MTGAHVCAVLGSPVAHSLSPLIHRTAYEVLGLADRWSYERHEVAEDELAGFIAACGPQWVGLSCTAPLKERLVELGEPTERARLLGSGNTYLFNDGAPQVHNTDVTGLLGALARVGVREAGSAILVGNGATARSALAALADLGVRDVLVLARSADRAAAGVGGVAEALGIRWTVAPFGEVPDADRVDLLVSTVSAPVPEAVATGLVALTEASFEATYNHYPTTLDVAARAAGIPACTGLDLLVGQALDQITLMTGQSCPPEPLLRAVHAAVTP